MMQNAHPALFLDRDGVINLDTGHAHRIDDIIFIDGVFDFIREVHRLGWPIFIATNQAGIAHGLYGEDDFHELMQWMLGRVEREGGKIQHVYFCPHHVDAKIAQYRKDCACRKPRPGMLLRAQREFNIDLENSYLIGDRQTDMEAAQNSGIRHAFQLKTGQSTSPQFSSVLQLLRSSRAVAPE